MSKTAFDKISEGLRDAMAGNFARIHIDGVTWVRADSGSPEDELAFCRQHIAELTTKIDVLASEHANEIERLSVSIRGLDKQRLQEKGLWENEERRLKAEIEQLQREDAKLTP